MLNVVNILGTTGLPSITPNGSDGFPLVALANEWIDNIAFLALAMVIVGLVLSAGLWAVGAFSNNYTQSVNGKKGFLICAASALVIGAANAGILWFYNQGNNITGGGAGNATN